MSSEIEVVQLDHIPSRHVIHLALFQDVGNAEFLHKQLLSRNADFEYAFVDASVIVSRLHLLSAVFKAVTSASNDVLKTPNVHSEIVANLAASNNVRNHAHSVIQMTDAPQIAEAYRRYGVSTATKNLVAVKVAENGSPSTEQIAEHLAKNVEGTQVPATDEKLASTADMSKVFKYYKLNGLNWLDKIKDHSAKQKEVEMLVVGAMALRGL
ncbi:kinase binding protein CGI-121-domain-containing protein [Emericellopsis atlantica]|uniref:EKC/KEOPS complex subunit CGI121 n=1 Tax=Emericellopsis atlantica TaxID=2614577 RepID=A0A9P7ZNG2_9HYPO|nr:kinase binding protein CGI-121-domain-containing protein [Emericellopsis atlantica]KAG9254780.1 kinase binding protein CGI-121-domain-containing protein [Emericellopsis atlantica]